MTRWSVLLRRSAPSGKESRAPSASSTFVVEESLGYLVNRAARLMAAELGERLRPSGIGIGQWALLLLLWTRDGSSQAELARFAAIEAPTVVRTIDRMVRDGLVNRATDPADARLSRIFLTARGRTLRDELVPLAIGVNETFRARLSAREADTLQRLLIKLITEPARL